MADPREWVTCLNSIRHAFSSELRQELISDRAKETAEYIDMALARMITDLQSGPQIARESAADWKSLSNDFKQLIGRLPAADREPTLVDSDSADGSFARLETQMKQLQEHFKTAGFADNFLRSLAIPGSDPERWLIRAANAAFNFSMHYEEGIPPIPMPEPQQRPEDEESKLRRALNGYLKKRYPELPSDPLTQLNILTGGLGKRTALFQLAENRLLPGRLVLRVDIPAGATTDTTVINEFPLVKELHSRGMPVPLPILLETDPSVLGAPFVIMTEISNASRAGLAFREDRRMQRLESPVLGREFGLDMARTLARLHSVKQMPKDLLIPNDRSPAWTSPEQMVGASLKLWQASTKGPHSFATDLCFAWLLSHLPPANRPRCIIHGDVAAHNILVRDGRLAALLDWELAREGDPAEDLGFCRLLLIEGVLPWHEFVAEYIAAGGDPRACEERAVNFYGVWTWAMASARTTVVRAYIDAGKRLDIRATTYSWHLFAHMQYYAARELKHAVEIDASRKT